MFELGKARRAREGQEPKDDGRACFRAADDKETLGSVQVQISDLTEPWLYSVGRELTTTTD